MIWEKTEILLKNWNQLFILTYQAGISLSIDDLKIPVAKIYFVVEAEQQLDFLQIKTLKRSFNINWIIWQSCSWNKTRTNKKQVIDNFKTWPMS
jgi:hypothetical protein